MKVGNLVRYRPFPPMPDDEFPFGIVIEKLEYGYLILNISGKYTGRTEEYAPISLYEDDGWVVVS